MVSTWAAANKLIGKRNRSNRRFTEKIVHLYQDTDLSRLIDQIIAQGKLNQTYGIVDAQLGDKVFAVCLYGTNTKK